MRKVLLTEAQVRLINEEIDRNDSIQKLIFKDASEIDFELCAQDTHNFTLIPVIDGKKIGPEQVFFKAERITLNNQIFYQLHIEVNYNIRRLGIAEKLYTAFILKGYPVCSLSCNRGDAARKAIRNLWGKLAQNPQITVMPINYKGNIIGVIGVKK